MHEGTSQSAGFVAGAAALLLAAYRAAGINATGAMMKSPIMTGAQPLTQLKSRCKAGAGPSLRINPGNCSAAHRTLCTCRMSALHNTETDPCATMIGCLDRQGGQVCLKQLFEHFSLTLCEGPGVQTGDQDTSVWSRIYNNATALLCATETFQVPCLRQQSYRGAQGVQLLIRI